MHAHLTSACGNAANPPNPASERFIRWRARGAHLSRHALQVDLLHRVCDAVDLAHRLPHDAVAAGSDFLCAPAHARGTWASRGRLGARRHAGSKLSPGNAARRIAHCTRSLPRSPAAAHLGP
eukprot:359240-Chlamydomonas_euryale.AAC.3